MARRIEVIAFVASPFPDSKFYIDHVDSNTPLMTELTVV